MAKSINIKVQKKFEKVFKNIPNGIRIEYEKGRILYLMQEMYELGFADGYAEGITDIKNRISK